MSAPLLELQAQLPREIPLLRYAPPRARFDWRGWNPAAVRCAGDLPQYLVLGPLKGFAFSTAELGWSARWQGTERDTHFDVTFKAESRRWEIRQTWCGIDGGYCVYPSTMPLDQVVGQALNLRFPDAWDRAAKARLEDGYQLSYIEPPKGAAAFFGIPDGAFRSIAFPVSVRSLRRVRQWLSDLIDTLAPTYPVRVEAKRVFQAVNFVEGKAAPWTTQEAAAFCQSVDDTGLVPHGMPVREVASDGSAAWTLRRDAYLVFIGVPFAALTDFLARIAAPGGPVRRYTDSPLRFELRPVVLPAAFEIQVPGLTLWDLDRTTRTLLQFRADDATGGTPTVESFLASERDADLLLAQAEAASDAIATAIERIFEQSTDGGTA